MSRKKKFNAQFKQLKIGQEINDGLILWSVLFKSGVRPLRRDIALIKSLKTKDRKGCKVDSHYHRIYPKNRRAIFRKTENSRCAADGRHPAEQHLSAGRFRQTRRSCLLFEIYLWHRLCSHTETGTRPKTV